MRGENMHFVDGDATGLECPKCGKPTYFEMSFIDQFSYKTGHYTSDRPLIVCSDEKCDFWEDINEHEEPEYDGVE